MQKWCLWIFDFQVWFLKDGDECSGVRRYDAALWVSGIVIGISVVKDLDARETKDR